MFSYLQKKILSVIIYTNSKGGIHMTKEEAYIKHKKQNLIHLVNDYNNGITGNQKPFEIDEEHLDIEKTFCTPQRCKNCGQCCDTYPCIFSPYDFLDITDRSYMESIFHTGLVAISQTDNGVLVVRPRGAADEKTVVSLQTSHNPCLMLGENGCLLPPEYRPSNGLLLYPIDNLLHHRIMYSYDIIEDEYEKFQSLMWAYFTQYEKQVIPVETIQNKETYLPHFTEEAAMSLTKKLIGH